MAESQKAVFLSYASQDAEAARRICEALRKAGIEVWFDQSELRGGDAWDQKIRGHIKDCALFIPIISGNTDGRTEGYFRLEWKLAVDRSHLMADDASFLLPVVIDATPDATARVPDRFRQLQWSRLPSGETSPAFVERVSSLLTPDASSASPQFRQSAGIGPRHSGPKPVASPKLPPTLLIIAAVAVIAAGYLAVDKFVLSKHGTDSGRALSVAQSSISAPAAIPEKSIAVLPFTDMSEKKDQEYFSDGLSEELIDLLAKGTDMRVAARTSAFSFKGKQATIPEIAKALGVANVLEGSVRKAGPTLRVTAQLIRAADGYHVWSDSYDRELKDVFKVQDEIAAAVVVALKAQLSGMHAPASAHRTANTDAYNEYLLGKEAYRTPNVASLTRSVEAYSRAIALDPQFAAAYAALADARLFLESIRNNGHQTDAELKRAFEGASRAVTLDPDLAEGYSARAMVLQQMWDWAGSESDLREALKRDPRDSTARRRYGRLLAILGRIPEAIAAERQAIEADPLDSYAWTYLSQFLLAAGKLNESRAATQRAHEINPTLAEADDVGPTIDLLQGKPEALLAFSKGIQDDALRLSAVAIATQALGRVAESKKSLDELIAKFATTEPTAIAEVYGWRGDDDQALQWLTRAYDLRDLNLYSLNYRVAYTKLRDDSRYAALLRKMRLL